ncbi:hypothetical protein PSYMO_38233, partial [Pseudomonas amygdali pv. mori str. 301020]
AQRTGGVMLLAVAILTFVLALVAVYKAMQVSGWV